MLVVFNGRKRLPRQTVGALYRRTFWKCFDMVFAHGESLTQDDKGTHEGQTAQDGHEQKNAEQMCRQNPSLAQAKPSGHNSGMLWRKTIFPIDASRTTSKSKTALPAFLIMNPKSASGVRTGQDRATRLSVNKAQ
jgi:hypothetical protein